MGETRHTPGPWLVDSQTVYALDERNEVNRFSCNMQVGYRVHSSFQKVRTGYEELEANAQLIAAAPDLLADAIEAERMFRWYGDMHAAKPDLEKAARNYEMADRLAATIAKATTPATASL